MLYNILCVLLCSAAVQGASNQACEFGSRFPLQDVGELAKVLTGEFSGKVERKHIVLAVGSPGQPSKFMVENMYELGTRYDESTAYINYTTTIVFESQPKSVHSTANNLAVHLENGRVETWPVRDEAVTSVLAADTVVGGKSFGLALANGTIRVWGTPLAEGSILSPVASMLQDANVEALWGEYGMFFMNVDNGTARYGVAFVGVDDGPASAVQTEVFDQVFCTSKFEFFVRCASFHPTNTIARVWSLNSIPMEEISVSGRTSNVVDVQMDFEEVLVLQDDGKALVLRNESRNPAPPEALVDVRKLVTPFLIQRTDGRVFAWRYTANSDIGVYDDVTFSVLSMVLLKNGQVETRAVANVFDAIGAAYNFPEGVASFQNCPASDYLLKDCVLDMDDGSSYFLGFAARTTVKSLSVGRNTVAVLDDVGRVITIRIGGGAIEDTIGEYLTCSSPVMPIQDHTFNPPVSVSNLSVLGSIIGEQVEGRENQVRLWGSPYSKDSSLFVLQQGVQRLWPVFEGGVIEKADGGLDVFSTLAVLLFKETLTKPEGRLKTLYRSKNGEDAVSLTQGGVLSTEALSFAEVSERIVVRNVSQLLAVNGEAAFFLGQDGKLFAIERRNYFTEVVGATFDNPLGKIDCMQTPESTCWTIQQDGTILAFKYSFTSERYEVVTLSESIENAVELTSTSSQLGVRTESGIFHHMYESVFLPALFNVEAARGVTFPEQSDGEEYLFVKYNTGVAAIQAVRNGQRVTLKSFSNVESAYFSTKRAYLLKSDGSLETWPESRSSAKEGRFKAVFVSPPFARFSWVDAVAVRLDGSLAIFGSSLAQDSIDYFQSNGTNVQIDHVTLTQHGFLAVNTQGTEGYICTVVVCSPFFETRDSTFSPSGSPTEAPSAPTLEQTEPALTTPAIVALVAGGGSILLFAFAFLFWKRRCKRQPSSDALSAIVYDKDSAFKYDAFLTHDWGEDGSNHKRVKQVNDYLRQNGVNTWFDEDRLTGNISHQISNGLSSSNKVVVFVTRRYMLKLNKEDEDYCREEFLAACRLRGVKNMVVCVMEEDMLTPSSWIGVLQLKLAGELYIDFSSPQRLKANLPTLLERIQR